MKYKVKGMLAAVGVGQFSVYTQQNCCAYYKQSDLLAAKLLLQDSSMFH